MKNKTVFTLFLIIIIAFLFRFWNLDKPEGLWNDEYVSWYAASRPSLSEFIDIISKNCHTPLYYVFLRFWLFLFPDTDLSLRISSAAASILLCIVMFFLGKEYKNSKTGLLCALFTALSSFYIYFAQEARLYSLLGLTSALTVFMCIKTLKYGRRLHFCLFIVLNAVLCALHTLGLIFSFFIIIFTLVYLYRNFDEWKKIMHSTKKLLQYIFPFIVVLVIISPFIFSIVFSKNLSQFWSCFSYSKIAFSFTDYFSPVQCNITNSPDTFGMYLFQNGSINYTFVITALLPSLIAFILLLKAFLQKEKILNLLLYACACFFAVLIILSTSGRMILLTKYSSALYPVLILAFSEGLLSLKNKALRNAVFITYFGISLLYLYFSPVSAPKLSRPEGNRAPVVLIENSRLRQGDIVVFTYYDYDKFQRYMPDYNYYRIFSVSKFNFNKPVFGNSSLSDVVQNGKDKYRSLFKEFPNQNVIKWADETLKPELHKGDRIGIVYLRGVSFLSNEDILRIAEDDKEYNRTSIVFLAFSMLRNSLMYAFKDGFRIDSITQAGDWMLIVYEKTL